MGEHGISSIGSSLGNFMPSKLSCVGVPAATDILLGYHSEEGWTAAIHLLTGHYGLDVEVGFPTCILPLRNDSVWLSEMSATPGWHMMYCSGRTDLCLPGISDMHPLIWDAQCLAITAELMTCPWECGTVMCCAPLDDSLQI